MERRRDEEKEKWREEEMKRIRVEEKGRCREGETTVRETEREREVGKNCKEVILYQTSTLFRVQWPNGINSHDLDSLD
ncbi:hypothetical protein Bpfe_010756 [Biomphalaria pfeifferi]|uniref:Uncharacterized protein n=1 Tax=Biomphalaria pfeifferi TaxID=112525 RepID=A0AAD8FCG9_BIOPF|nr:hypothetical protein Bpfe_010756 [Biomphalaria pfeifferi]